MDADSAIRIGREALFLALILSGIPVMAALLVGLIVSIFQAATQIQEQTLPVVPKILAVYASLAIAGAWLLHQLLQFTVALLESIRAVGLGGGA